MWERGVYTRIRFCPWCGTESLTRDHFARENKLGLSGKPKNRPYNDDAGPEFTCTGCGRGFRIGPSVRTAQADQLFAAHRKMRA